MFGKKRKELLDAIVNSPAGEGYADAKKAFKSFPWSNPVFLFFLALIVVVTAAIANNDPSCFTEAVKAPF